MVGKSNGKLKVTRTSDTTFTMQRVFDAPRTLVFETMTTPEYVKRWWCCMEGYTMPVCEIDLRVGGKWRYVMVGPEGEVGFHGEYREIDAPARIVQTEIFEPFPEDRKSTRLNSSHSQISYAVFCLKKKKLPVMWSPYPHAASIQRRECSPPSS